MIVTSVNGTTASGKTTALIAVLNIRTEKKDRTLFVTAEEKASDLYRRGLLKETDVLEVEPMTFNQEGALEKFLSENKHKYDAVAFDNFMYMTKKVDVLNLLKEHSGNYYISTQSNRKGCY